MDTRIWTQAARLFLSLGILIAAGASHAQTELTPQQEKATADITEYFRRTTARLASQALAEMHTLDDWERQRPVLREQLLEMLGLSPLPERTDLQATVTGTVEHDGFVSDLLDGQVLHERDEVFRNFDGDTRHELFLDCHCRPFALTYGEGARP